MSTGPLEMVLDKKKAEVPIEVGFHILTAK